MTFFLSRRRLGRTCTGLKSGRIGGDGERRGLRDGAARRRGGELTRRSMGKLSGASFHEERHCRSDKGYPRDRCDAPVFAAARSRHLSGWRTWGGTAARHAANARGDAGLGRDLRRASTRDFHRELTRLDDGFGVRRSSSSESPLRVDSLRALSRELILVARRLECPVRTQAAVAARHVRMASSRKTRSVRRDVRWRWTLKVFWTAA